MQEALQQQFVERAAPAEPHAKLRVILETQRAAFLRAGAPSLEERRADLARLGGAIRHESGRIADVISADFGHRSRHETELAEIFPVLSAIRHARSHLRRWMRPKRVPVGLESGRLAPPSCISRSASSASSARGTIRSTWRSCR